MLTDLHYVRALLNPFMIDVTSLHKDGVAKRALKKIIRKMSVSLGLLANKAMTKFIEFVEKTSPFHPLEALDIKQSKLKLISGGVL